MKIVTLFKVFCIGISLLQICRAQNEDFQSLKGSLYWSDEFDSLQNLKSNWIEHVGGCKVAL